MLATLWLLLGLPQRGASDFIPLYLFCFIVNGLVNSWPAPACNNPIFAGLSPFSLPWVLPSLPSDHTISRDIPIYQFLIPYV